METSSHALDQDRVAGLRVPRGGVHQPHARPPRLSRRRGTYLAAKLKLHRTSRRTASRSATPRTRRGAPWRRGRGTSPSASRWTPTSRPATWRATRPGCASRWASAAAAFPVALPLLGRFNVENALGAAAAALALGRPPRTWRSSSARRRRSPAGWSASPTRRASCCGTTPTPPTRSSARWRRSGRSPGGASSWCSAPAATATAASGR